MATDSRNGVPNFGKCNGAFGVYSNFASSGSGNPINKPVGRVSSGGKRSGIDSLGFGRELARDRRYFVEESHARPSTEGRKNWVGRFFARKSERSL